MIHRSVDEVGENSPDDDDDRPEGDFAQADFGQFRRVHGLILGMGHVVPVTLGG